ncbi:hypothetical protein I4U23_005528 [Adineta vaga]|nr:hypothetical protein I4U23_005528 [Adineta vaga]
MKIMARDKNRLAFDLAMKYYHLDRLVQQTPHHLMTPQQLQSFSTLNAEISALKAELYHLMHMDHDVV